MPVLEPVVQSLTDILFEEEHSIFQQDSVPAIDIIYNYITWTDKGACYLKARGEVSNDKSIARLHP